MAAVVVECTTTAAMVVCDLCGTDGYVSREAGSIADRLADFAGAHLAPRVLAVQIEANGLDCGWVEA